MNTRPRGLALGVFVVLLASTVLAQDDVAQLVAQLGEKTDYNKRNAAYRALLAQKPRSALPLLAKVLPGYELTSQSLGLSILQSYPKDQSHTVLRKLLKSKSAFLELGAAAALYHAGDKSMVDHILHGLEDSGSARATSSMLRRIYSVREARVAATVRKLLDPLPATTVLDAVLRYLKYSKDPEGPRAVKKLLANSEPSDLKGDSRAVCAYN